MAVCNMYFGASAEALHLVRKAMLCNPRYPAAYASVLEQINNYLGDFEPSVAPLLLTCLTAMIASTLNQNRRKWINTHIPLSWSIQTFSTARALNACSNHKSH